jgi:hypothetical protein
MNFEMLLRFVKKSAIEAVRLTVLVWIGYFLTTLLGFEMPEQVFIIVCFQLAIFFFAFFFNRYIEITVFNREV